jgi:FKBP-type peptidyl-prolyl cis-trans isomerase 2
MKKSFLLLGMLLLLFSGCLVPDTGPETQNTTNLTAQYGDTVTVDYTLRVDGVVKDTSLISVAKNTGLYNANRSYQPFSFNMLLGGNTINGFVNGVLAMEVGETKNFTVSPVDGYGLSDPNKITNLSRYYNRSVFEKVPISFFDAYNYTLEKGKVISTENLGFIAIENVTNNTVTIRYLFSKDHKFAMFGLPQTVVNLTNDSMTLRFDLDENKSYIVIDPVTGKSSLATVTYADNESIILDENHAFAGKELDFEVTMRSIIRPSIIRSSS